MAALKKGLDEREAKALRELLLVVAEHVPEARRLLLDAIESGSSGKRSSGRSSEGLSEAALQRAVEAIDGGVESYDRHLVIGGDTSDLDAIALRLEALRQRGEHDAVVRFGEAIWERAEARIERSDEEWEEVAQSLQECLDVVFRALPASSLSPAEQLLWVLNRAADDEYGVLDEADDFLAQGGYARDAWRAAAESLEERLADMPLSRKRDSSDAYRRSRVFEQLTRAWIEAGQEGRVVSVLQRSASNAVLALWRDAVERLIATGRPSAYRLVGELLERVRDALRANGRESEWAPAIERLRVMHKRKRRLLQVLDALNGRAVDSHW